ncbi:pantothenate kinase 2 [Hordeum vulgare]|nr:pantothenate kinase 2 [Hordeum vulgare]
MEEAAEEQAAASSVAEFGDAAENGMEEEGASASAAAEEDAAAAEAATAAYSWLELLYSRLTEEPAAYGKFGLANLLELREECLREFQFFDPYVSIKQRENEASLAILPHLLMELDSMDEEDRLLALIEGVLAAKIFDWGSKACVDLYNQGTIIEIYRMSRKKMQRPWRASIPSLKFKCYCNARIDDFDTFKSRMLKKDQPYKRALISVDNACADVVLGMLPLAREFLCRGVEVVLVANLLPALNDITTIELSEIVAEAAKHCGILRKAAEAGGLIVDAMAGIQDDTKDEPASVPLMVVENGCGSPCIDFRQVSSELAAAAKDVDLLILEGMGRSLHTNLNARFKYDALKLLLFYSADLFDTLPAAVPCSPRRHHARTLGAAPPRPACSSPPPRALPAAAATHARSVPPCPAPHAPRRRALPAAAPRSLGAAPPRPAPRAPRRRRRRALSPPQPPRTHARCRPAPPRVLLAAAATRPARPAPRRAPLAPRRVAPPLAAAAPAPPTPADLGCAGLIYTRKRPHGP